MLILYDEAGTYLGFGRGGRRNPGGLISTEGLLSKGASFLQRTSSVHRSSSLLRSQRGPNGQTQTLAVIRRRPQEVRRTLTLRLAREP